MTNYRVVVTRRAERDLQSIADWLYERSPEDAQRWVLAAWEAIDSLGEKAGVCPPAPENDHSDHNVRNVLFKTRKGRVYRAVFVADDETVTVTHIRGPGQNLLPPDEFPGTDAP